MADLSNSGNGTNKYGKVAAGLGLATAAAFGAAWANSRQRLGQTRSLAVGTATPTAPGKMIDWEKVRGTARRMNATAEPDAQWRQHWNGYYSEMVKKAVPIIEDYAHTPFPRHLDTVNVVSRMDWVDANILSFQQLFGPIEKLYQDAARNTSAFNQAVQGAISQTVLSAEVGILLGYLARRVLGQYDLSLLGQEPLSTGKVYFVEPNIAGVVQNLGIDGDEFRLWIALHETTHAFEFESHPWVRQHFNAILERYFGLISNELRQSGGFGRFIQRFRENDQKSAWIERVMSPEQRTLFSELQALMSIVEGYSNHMMNAIGVKLMPNYDQIKDRMESRQKNRGVVDRLFIKLTGLDLKMEQYRLGEIFVDAVVAKKGIDFANLMWAEAKYLPTLEEVKQPDLWVSRVEGMQAA